MAVHFIHIGKTGGTAIHHALSEAGKPSTPFGKITLHGHKFKLAEVGDDEYAFFAVRDPVERFVSSFYSRLRKGAPRYNVPWNLAEELAFGWFQTPQALGNALAGSGHDHSRAVEAMKSIRHVKWPHTHWLKGPKYLRKRADRIAFIARQESLSDDWERLKVALELPGDLSLPSDPVRAHRTDPGQDRTLSADAREALRHWYAKDYELLAVCDEIRAAVPVLQ